MKNILMCLYFFFSFLPLASGQIPLMELLEKNLLILEKAQNPNGAFYPVNCLDKKMKTRCKSDRSLFFSGLIAESLSSVNHPKATAIHDEVINYLERQYHDQDGLLRYFEKDFHFYKIVKPDMDDNSVVYSALLSHGGVEKKELQKKYQELFKAGLIKTDIKRKKSKEVLKEAQYFATWLPPKKPFFDDIDLVVNANSLYGFALYNKDAQEKINLAPICETVNTVVSWSARKNFDDLTSDRSWILRKKSNYSQWYPSKYAVMYSLVRAHLTMGESSCLKSSYQKIRKHLLLKTSLGENIYDQALATAALSRITLKEKIRPDHLEVNLRKLAEDLEQEKYGKNPFYFFNIGYTGSIDLVRALLIEGIDHLLKNSERQPASKALAETEFMDQILSEQMEDGSFTALIIPSSPLYNIFVVMMYEYLGLSEEKKEITKALVEYIFTMQKSSGALAGYPEGPDHPGISTAGYIAAKIAGYPDEDPRMKKLELRIKELGGPLKSDMLTIPFMMMFSLYPVHTTFNTNLDRFLMRFDKSLPWVKVLLHPVLFLLDNGHNMVLPESKYPARIFKQPYSKYSKRVYSAKKQKDDKFIKWALENINPDGTFFDYTPTTVPMLMALSKFPSQKDLVMKGIETIESFQQKTKEGHLLQTPGEASIGETFYMANALLDVGINHKHPTIREAERYLLQHQLKTGGWGFSKNSIHFADSDDTSNAMYFLIRLDHLRGKKIRKEVFKALDWLLTLQNKDGGFGTWEATKGGLIGNLINRVANKKGLVMSESVFEHTARIVVCLSYLKNEKEKANKAYKRAYKWLLRQQNKDGSFAGTWFINYMFSTSMAMTALSTDVEAGEKAILKGMKYLKRKQSPDGGFGESPDSFLEKKAVYLDRSSWSQTGLVVSQLHTMDAITSCKYHEEMRGLLDTSYLYLRDESDGWTKTMDFTWTAVTFPKVEYLIYPYIQRMVPWQAYNMHLNTKCR